MDVPTTTLAKEGNGKAAPGLLLLERTGSATARKKNEPEPCPFASVEEAS